MVADHERSTGPPHWNTTDLVGGLEVHPGAMDKNLSLTYLADRMGRQVAHDLVYDLCRRSASEDVPLVELLCAGDKVAGDRLRWLCGPTNYLGLSVAVVERVVGSESRTLDGWRDA
ncbi:hypothetical protein HD554DRAFT_612168 [Boletus coccyginus]|nr:hypothetical protein HD554DRAFT_612168 [Boletus coccyginus]